jgi:threonine aldolase
MKNAAFFYVWDEHTRECRLMTSWRTTETDIQNLLAIASSHIALRTQS